MGSWFEVKDGYLVWIDRAARVFQIETQLRVRWKEPRIGSNRAPRAADEVAARPPSTPVTLIWFLRNVNNFEVFSRTEKTGIFQIVMWWGWVVLKKPFDIIHERLQVDLLWFSDIVRNDWTNTTLPAEKKLTATTFFTYFSLDFFLQNPAPDKILKQTKTPAPIKF